MKRLLLIGCVLMLAACASLLPSRSMEEVAWAEMCSLAGQLYGYRCDGITPPLVTYESMRDGLYGYYEGGDTVFVSTNITPEEKMGTLIHEMVHYLHVQLGLVEVPGPAGLICKSEEEAWELEGIWSGTDNSGWWRPYTHCWKWYANPKPDWPHAPVYPAGGVIDSAAP